MTLGGAALPASAATITIATVNNSQMVEMQKLSPTWEKQTGNKLNWVVLEENVLRQRVTTDIATNGGQFDIVTIGSYETPTWGKQGWLAPLAGFPASLRPVGHFQPGARSLSAGGKLYALPFYAESSFTYYRTDLFKQAGLTMPAQPKYTDIQTFADKLTDRASSNTASACAASPAGARTWRSSIRW